MDSLSQSRDTLDTLFQGKLRIYQSRTGYRISLDPVLLAQFISLQEVDTVMDLGTGNGVLPLILAFMYPSLSITGLEIQTTMAARAVKNVQLNGFESRVRIARVDVCVAPQHFAPESFDAVICNPPYRGPGSGRLSPNSERRGARHETLAKLEDFVRAASYLLRRKGRLAMIYSAGRSVDLLMAMRAHRVEPKRLRMVHSYAAGEASMVLAEGVKGGNSGITILAPLVVYDENKDYTAEVERMLAGNAMSA